MEDDIFQSIIDKIDKMSLADLKLLESKALDMEQEYKKLQLTFAETEIIQNKIE